MSASQYEVKVILKTSSALEPLGIARGARACDGAGMEPLRILVVDDHDVVQWGFRLMLGRQPWVERCDGARNPEEAIAAVRRFHPDVALVDLFLGQDSGAELCERLREEEPAMGVLLMSGAGRLSSAAGRAVGAAGFVSKSWSAADLEAAVRAAARGQTLYDAEPVEDEVDLSARERDVLALIARGATNREIAVELRLSPHTVKDHTSSLYRKLGVRNRAEAAQRAPAVSSSDR